MPCLQLQFPGPIADAGEVTDEITFGASRREYEVKEPPTLQIVILDRVAIDDLIGKVEETATQPGAADRVNRWRVAHGPEYATPNARSFVVVASTLMFLHPCPDGVILPFAAYPDGTVKVYSDPDHAGESFYRDDEMRWPSAPEPL
jgi:hypothetical protein